MQDAVFRALADPTRRRLLDRLHEENGPTLGRLCAGLGMSRQAASQHLAVLEEAGLVTVVRRGRERLHYLNPVPLHEVQERWIDKFERPRLRALAELKRRAEDAVSDRPTYVYVTYIESTPGKVWEALTDAELTAAYWGHANVSDWRPESRWEHRRTDGSGVVDAGGTVLEADPPRRLVLTFGPPEEGAEASTVAFDIEPYGAIVRVTVTHTDLPDEEQRDVAAKGWTAVLANLKTLLETGHVLPEAPWEMP
ncbi:ArsR/SmtB family transcription factor [Actinomadura parmotrematis]|uniref:Metalloregulator ArsR/SmtB family transcription factor n=1 Tax=Actinomadura parmotrematis TaxID=2864039 RepID=A0ABS7G4E4_9ACTN|nr:metalloregulator ArsR/SmtB family transcription factor [Actinomadura parmotrematis]MBW8487597.1 metalloregulator ArsR/SmtB family transcription factor [Actinomadura parmotrematis]